MMRTAHPILSEYEGQKVRKRLWMEARRQSSGAVERTDHGRRIATCVPTTAREMKIEMKTL
jgi:hypothetical protein